MSSCRQPRLKNIDRSTGTSMAVTVGDVTVVITDYKPIVGGRVQTKHVKPTAADVHGNSRDSSSMTATVSSSDHTIIDTNSVDSIRSTDGHSSSLGVRTNGAAQTDDETMSDN